MVRSHTLSILNLLVERTERGAMTVTLSPAAEQILSTHKDFRDHLVEAIQNGFKGSCFMDGRVGRTHSNDELIIMAQGQDAITVPVPEFDESTIKDILKRWSSS